MTAPHHDALALGAIAPTSYDDRAIVYTAPGVTLPSGSAAAYREYRRSTLADADTGVLDAMSEHLAALAPAAAGEVRSVAAWPSGIVESAGQVRGILIPPTPTGLAPVGVGAAAPRTDHDTYSWLSMLAAALWTLHGHDIVAGDLVTAGLSVPVDQETTRVFFTDADRMLLRGRSPWPSTEAAGWDIGSTHPGEAAVTRESDVFKLGLFALRLLSGDPTTRDPSALPAEVPPAVRQLVETAVSAAAADRPNPADWMPALDTATTSSQGQRSRAVAPATTSRSDHTPPAGTPATSATRTSGGPTGVHGSTWTRARRLQVARGTVVAGVAGVAVLLAVLVALGNASDESDPTTREAARGAPGDEGDTATESTTSTTRPRTTTTSRGTTATTEPPLTGRWFEPDVGDDCGATRSELLGGERVLISCGDSWSVLDLATGDVTDVLRETSPNGDQVRSDDVVGDRYVWWDAVDTPASGLDPPYRTLTLQARDLTGGDEEQLLVREGDQDAEADIVYAHGSRFLSFERFERFDGDSSTQGTLVLRDIDGAELARFDEVQGFDDDSELFDGIVHNGDAAIDLTRAEVVPDDAATVESIDPCTQTGISWSTEAVVRRDVDGLRTHGTTPADLDARIDAVASGNRLLAYQDGLAAFTTEGTRLWELPTDVIARWEVFGGTLFVINDADEVVAVDPATGTETTVPGDLREAAEIWLQHDGYGTEDVDMDTDSATGNVLLQDGTGRLKLVNLPACRVR